MIFVHQLLKNTICPGKTILPRILSSLTFYACYYIIFPNEFSCFSVPFNITFYPLHGNFFGKFIKMIIN